jgi:hypothetical protein
MANCLIAVINRPSSVHTIGSEQEPFVPFLMLCQIRLLRFLTRKPPLNSLSDGSLIVVRTCRHESTNQWFRFNRDVFPRSLCARGRHAELCFDSLNLFAFFEFFQEISRMPTAEISLSFVHESRLFEITTEPLATHPATEPTVVSKALARPSHLTELSQMLPVRV